MLLLRFTKLSDQRHSLAYVRSDGTGETSELETRSFLVHDFVHYAVETEAGLKHSFYGLLDAGHNYSELNAKDEAQGATVIRDEVGMTEGVVGPLQTLLTKGADPETFLELFAMNLEAQGQSLPPYLDTAFVARVAERFRRLQGAWKATRYGGTLELRFPEG